MGDVEIIWFPKYNYYGYITSYSTIQIDKPYKLHEGNAPFDFNGKYFSGRALIIITGKGNYDFIFDGVSVSENAKFPLHRIEITLINLNQP